MHENIRRFHLDGVVKYEMLSHVRETFERTIEENMRDSGYVPLLDMDPQLTQSLDNGGNFEVTMSVYGVFIGEDSWKVAGVMGGKPILKHTQSHK